MSAGGIQVLGDSGLRAWRAWMVSSDHHKELGYPSTSPGFVTGGINCWDDLEESIGGVLVQAVDSIVAGLEVIERGAIYHHYLACVWRAREGVLEEALERAVGKVGRKLIERGLG